MHTSLCLNDNVLFSNFLYAAALILSMGTNVVDYMTVVCGSCREDSVTLFLSFPYVSAEDLV